MIGNKILLDTNIYSNFLNKKKVEIIDANHETSKLFAIIKNQLKQDGKPIPINDIWIAAHSMQTYSTLISNDKHFNYIKNIKVLNI